MAKCSVATDEDRRRWATRQDEKHLKRLLEEHRQIEEGHRYWRQLIESELRRRANEKTLQETNFGISGVA